MKILHLRCNGFYHSTIYDVKENFNYYYYRFIETIFKSIYKFIEYKMD